MGKGKKMSSTELRAMIDDSPTLRAQVFRDFCRHVEEGYSVDCFPALSIATIELYFKLYSKEFNREIFEESLRKGKAGWEQIGRRQSTGDCLGNSRSWYYNMAHRYGWSDKLDIKAQVDSQVSVNVVNYATQPRLESTVGAYNT